MPSLELKLPPPLVAIAVAALMATIAFLLPAAGLPLPKRSLLAGLLVASGVLVALAGIVGFHRHRTTVNPHTPERTTTLVTSGIYRHTRNPMYLGLLLVLAGWAAWLANAASLPLLAVFVLYLNRYQIGPEERTLALRFGEAFNDYRAAVRRWL